MTKAIQDCVFEVGWKKKALLRTQRFHCDMELINLWKSHILSYIEYRTAAWYHACETSLAPLDRCLTSFLHSIGVDTISALMKFNLAPLTARRDMAMLAIIHRTVLQQGPEAFSAFIRVRDPTSLRRSERHRRRTSRVLVEYRNTGSKLETMRRSLLGLISVYNLLPEEIVRSNSVKMFQSSLQSLMKRVVSSHGEQWLRMYSPRCDFTFHMLRDL